MVGYVKALRTESGYGFIRPKGGGGDAFFHISDLDPSLTFDAGLEHLRVEFELVDTPKGRAAKYVRAAKD